MLPSNFTATSFWRSARHRPPISVRTKNLALLSLRRCGFRRHPRTRSAVRGRSL